jgi:hypothetical protein
MSEKDPLMIAVGKVAQASRNKKQQPNALADARAELVAARVERAIMTAFDPDPPYEPIRAQDRIRLAKILKDGLS